MKRKHYNRMIKKVHEINIGPLSYPIIIKKLKPLINQTNYNPKLKEWFGDEEYDIIAETNGIFEAFKESEQWEEIGMLSIHDWKCTVNDNIDIDTNCLVQRADTNEEFEVIFAREFIGEVVIGLRPVTK